MTTRPHTRRGEIGGSTCAWYAAFARALPPLLCAATRRLRRRLRLHMQPPTCMTTICRPILEGFHTSVPYSRPPMDGMGNGARSDSSDAAFSPRTLCVHTRNEHAYKRWIHQSDLQCTATSTQPVQAERTLSATRLRERTTTTLQRVTADRLPTPRHRQTPRH